MDTSDSLRSLGVTLTSIEDGMHPTGSVRRRGLAREGWALLTYVLDGRPGPGLVRRYVRAVEVLGDSRPLDLPRTAVNFPCLLRFAEGLARPEQDSRHVLFERMCMAVAIADASPFGALRFMALDRTSRVAAVMKLGITIVGDIGFYVARLGSLLWVSTAKVFK
jgi:NADH dehydrogenase